MIEHYNVFKMIDYYLACLLWFTLFGNVIFIKQLHVSVKKNLNEWKQQVKYEPDIHHLDIGGVRETLTDTDEEGDQHQHAGQVDGHNSFKEKIFEVVGGMSHHIQQHRGNIHSKNCTK